MCKLTLNFKQLVSLVKTELAEQYENFENKFVILLNSKCSFINMKIPTPYDYSSTLVEILSEQQFSVSTTLRQLVSDYNAIATNFIIPNKANQKTTSLKAATSLSVKTVPPGTSKSSVSKSDSTQLPAKKVKMFRKLVNDIESKPDEKFYASCKTTHCREVCPLIVKSAPLTKCTHPNPHPSGYYPHVSRKIVRKIHQFKDYTVLLSMSGIPNPIAASTAQQMAPNVPKDNGGMEVEQSSSSTEVSSKKRKHDSVLTPEQDLENLKRLLRSAPGHQAPILKQFMEKYAGSTLPWVGKLKFWDSLPVAAKAEFLRQ